MQSCLYEGFIRHRRYEATSHEFRYSLFLSYLDLEEWPEIRRRGGIDDDPWGAAAFLRSDHFGDQDESLAEAVRRKVADHTGRRPAGPIRVLTLLRQFGYFFSPLTLYYCFGAGDEPEAILAEVSNTPWKERHVYVLGPGERRESAGKLRFRHRKEMHVSPFLTMDHEYDWTLSVPGDAISVHIANLRQGQKAFDASLILRRRPLTQASLRRLLVAYPWITLQVSAAIYFEAFRLWMKSCPYVPHPLHHDPAAQPA